MVYKSIILSMCLIFPLHAMQNNPTIQPRTSKSHRFKSAVKHFNFYDWLILTAGSTFVLGAIFQAFRGTYTKLFSRPSDVLKGTYKSLNSKVKFSAYGKANKKKIEERIINTLDRNISNFD